MKKKTVILIAALMMAAPVGLIWAGSQAGSTPEPMPMQADMYGMPASESYEVVDPAEEAGETEQAEEQPTEFNDDPELDLTEEPGDDPELNLTEEPGDDPEPDLTEEPGDDPGPMPEPSDPPHGGPAAAPGLLLSSEMVVYHYRDLQGALENDNGITTVYFGQNITMQLGGIRIHPSKRQVVVSGLNPLVPEQAEPYTLTDHSSASFFDTVYIDSAEINTLSVRDLNIVGKNFYGPFSVLDATALAKVLVVYERVNYNGPQLGYHRRGTVHIRDCTVSIHGGNGGSVNQEFSEVKHLVFHGNSSITTVTSDYTIFWHPYGGTFTLADDASLTVSSPNTSALYGAFFADAAIYKVEILIGERANLNMTISGVVAPGAYVTLSGFTVGEAGGFALNTTKTAAATVLRIAGALTVERNARFVVSGYGGASDSLLRQEGGDIRVMRDAVFHVSGWNAYEELVNLVGRAFICDDPASILLYNAGRAITAAAYPARIFVSAQQVNYWDTLSGGGLDAPALYKWDKPDGSHFNLDGTFSIGVNGDFTAISSNYTPGDPPGRPPDAAAFSMKKSRVLAFGRLELTVYQPSADATSISGITKPGAVVRASLSQGGVDYILPDVTADSAGIFHVPLSVTPEEAAVITVRASWNYLTADTEITVRGGGGALEFSVPQAMKFFTAEISLTAQTVKRLPRWEIVVSDGRGGGGWRLYARSGGAMAPDRAGLPALEDALVYVGGTGAQTVLGTDDILIASHLTASGGEVTPVSWDEDQGILLSVKPGTAFTETKYTTPILWTLIDAP